MKLGGFDQVSEMPKRKKSDCLSARLSAFENSGLIALKQVPRVKNGKSSLPAKILCPGLRKRAENALKQVVFHSLGKQYKLDNGWLD